MTYDEQFAKNVGGKIAERTGDDCGDSSAPGLSSGPSPSLSPEGERDLEREQEQGENSPTPRHDGWTPDIRVKFLEALARCGNVSSAAGYVQRSRTSAYNQKRRDMDFSRGWESALLIARDVSTDALQDRAINGIEEDVYYGGEVVGTRRRYETRLLLAHIARLDQMAERASVSRGAARFDEVIDAIGKGKDTAGFISEPTPDEFADIIADAEAAATVREVEIACERQSDEAMFAAIRAQEKAEEAAEDAQIAAEAVAEYGPTHLVDWGDGSPPDYHRMFEDAAAKLCADHPHITARRVEEDDPDLLAAMAWTSELPG